tara:strand:+ start:373 stop:513 length:141 start_codon:yes stop_codon:yes gene_type:complete
MDVANQNARANQKMRQDAGVYDIPQINTGGIKRKVFNEQTGKFEYK